MHLFIPVFKKFSGYSKIQVCTGNARGLKGKQNMVPAIKNITVKQETQTHKHDYNAMRQGLIKEVRHEVLSGRTQWKEPFMKPEGIREVFTGLLKGADF